MTSGSGYGTDAVAQLQGTSVNAPVRVYLARMAGESEARQGIEEFLTTVTGAAAGSGRRTWTRD